MIELEAVDKWYGGRREVIALQGVDLSVRGGELLVVTGPSGAGKTTLLRLLCAAELASAGVVRIFGHDVAKLRSSSIRRLRQRVAVVYQDLKLLADRTALANVALPLEIRALSRSSVQTRAAAALASFGLAAKVDVPVARLSMGERQRVAVARAMAMAPSVLLADEPTGNLDRDLTEDLMWQLYELSTLGTTVVVTTNDQEVIDAAYRNQWRQVHLEGGQVAGAAGERHDLLDTARNLVPFPPLTAPGELAEC
jgi:cell division transport system ATP-binding protein